MRISHLISQALGEMGRRWSLGLILVVCIASSFLVFGCFLLITQNLKGAEEGLKREVQIEVYLNDEITPLQFHLLLQSIKRFPEVEKVEYRSPKEALAQLESFLGKDLLEGLDHNPLPASFLLGLKSEYKGFEKVAGLASRIKAKNGVEDVEFGGVWLKKLDRALFIFIVVDVIFGLFIAVAVIMIVSNFMRIVVLSQARSIQIMGLLGASVYDVSLPIFIQGLLLGGAGASLGVLFLWTGHLIFKGQMIPVGFLPFGMIMGLVAWGMILGVGGSFLSIRKVLQDRS